MNFALNHFRKLLYASRDVCLQRTASRQTCVQLHVRPSMRPTFTQAAVTEMWRIRNSEQTITAVAPQPVQEVLKSANTDMGALAKELVEMQLLVYEEHQADATERSQKISSLFDTVAGKIADSIGDDPEEDVRTIQSIPEAVVRRAIWRWERLPYTALCVARQSVAAEFDDSETKGKKVGEITDVDEWVIRNERWLRDSKPPVWSQGVVRLSKHAAVVFPSSTVSDTCRTITRPTSLEGYMFLHQRRAPAIQIQPSVSAFAAKFEQMTDGLLRGLNWDNLFVAGGIVLGALKCVDDPAAVHKSSEWKNSDIDIYVHGLGPTHANKKMKHIFEVFKSNLPAGAPALVVRNSKTVTFYSNYPLRRIQVVLKLVGSPKDVLLNFDLDICSVGWDGSEVWLLPRAVRALETGYNIFTMNLIHGHYLGERRATQEQRVFKYASKGYGIRIFPSYTASLEEWNLKRDDLSTEKVKLQDLNLTTIAKAARTWTKRVVRRYLEWNHTNQLHYIDEYNLKTKPKLKITDTTLPVFTHLLLDTRTQKTEEPINRSCLTGFELLMRHVCLWEQEVKGRLRIQDDIWASTTYEEVDALLSYDDTPKYSWDESFSIEDFTSEIERLNSREFLQLEDNMLESGFANERREEVVDNLVSGIRIRRSSFASSVDEILDPSGDIVTPLYLPTSFVEFANDLIVQALKDAGLSAKPPLERPTELPMRDDEKLTLVFWRLSGLAMWQLLDRRIDEVHEVLWSFRRANERLLAREPHRRMMFKTQVSRRAIRKSPQDEFKAFARWVGRTPINGASSYPGIGQGFWDGFFDDEDSNEGADEFNREDSADDEEFEGGLDSIPRGLPGLGIVQT